MCDSGKDHTKVRCLIERRPDASGQSCTWPFSAVALEDLFEGCEIGEKVELELAEYEQHELDAMPEFEGW